MSITQIADNVKRQNLRKNWRDVFALYTGHKESQAGLFEGINKEVEAFLSKENNDTNSTDGIFNF